MNFDSVWPFFVCMFLLWAAASTSVFKAADTPPNPQPRRVLTLDGLRGFLALAVFFHHIAIYHQFIVTGVWRTPSSRFYSELGPIGVNFFFMITGYLFSGKLLRQQGHADWFDLYVGRIFRIGPLYLLAFACMTIIVFASTGFVLHVSIFALFRSLAVAFSLGLIGIKGINGYARPYDFLDEVGWTLHYEWMFYFCLPILSLVFRRMRSSVSIILLCSIIFCGMWMQFVPHHILGIELALPFLMGILSASLIADARFSPLPNRLASAITVALLVLSFWTSSFGTIGLVLPLGIAFYLISSGCTLFGLLVARTSRRLGDISYGIYLLQGLPQALFFRTSLLHRAAIRSAYTFWAFALASSLLLIVFALVTHVYVERSGIDAGKAFLKRCHQLTGRFRSPPRPYLPTNPWND